LFRTEADFFRIRRKMQQYRPRRDFFSPTYERDEQRMLQKIGLFDSCWYVETYPEVTKTGKSALQHFLDEGYLDGLKPNPVFDPAWYLRQYDDVRRSGLNPLVHYALHGYREGRDPSADFKTE